MRAYALQDKGLDTVDANHALGFATDERVFLPAARILDALGITQLRLITNNPDKISQLENVCGIKVKERLPLWILPAIPYNEHYIATKKHRNGPYSSGQQKRPIKTPSFHVAPKIADPMRTELAPKAIASSKSSLIPIDKVEILIAFSDSF